MPEGDSYARAAAKLRPALVGKTIEEIDGVPAVRAAANRLIGQQVDGVRTRGKHLLVDFDNGLTIHVWFGMTGWIRVRRLGGSAVTEGQPHGPRDDPGAIRLRMLSTAHEVVCYSSPTVEVERRRVIDRSLARLGPDVLESIFDYPSYRQRASLLPAETTVADFLLDQRVMSGVGNEYKNEILFLEHLHPRRALGSLDTDSIDALATRARKLMIPNAERTGVRVTTGYRPPDLRSWVFERTGRPCHRCNTPISSDRIGAKHPRMTYWCPVCQPAP